MNQKGTLVQRIADLMLRMDRDDLKIEDFDKNRLEIMTIAEACKKDPLYRRTLKQQYEFYRPLKTVPLEKAVLMAWAHFLDRCSNVPTKQHLHGVAVLCFPIIGDMMKHRKVKI